MNIQFPKLIKCLFYVWFKWKVICFVWLDTNVPFAGFYTFSKGKICMRKFVKKYLILTNLNLVNHLVFSIVSGSPFTLLILKQKRINLINNAKLSFSDWSVPFLRSDSAIIMRSSQLGLLLETVLDVVGVPVPQCRARTTCQRKQLLKEGSANVAASTSLLLKKKKKQLSHKELKVCLI